MAYLLLAIACQDRQDTNYIVLPVAEDTAAAPPEGDSDLTASAEQSVFYSISCGDGGPGAHNGLSLGVLAREKVTSAMLRIECATCAVPVEEHPVLRILEGDGWFDASWYMTGWGEYVPGESTTAACYFSTDLPSLHIVTAELEGGETACAIAGPKAMEENDRFGCGFVGEF